jgi:hypothetical protein
MILQPQPRYVIPPEYYAAWPPFEHQPHHSPPLAAHAETSSMHQYEIQAYPDPDLTNQPVIEPSTVDPAVFDSLASRNSSQFNPTIDFSHFDHIPRHAKVARRRGKAKVPRTILKNATRVGMERAQFLRDVEAGTSSVNAQGSSGVSSQSDMKIVPGSGVRKLLESLREEMRMALVNSSFLPAAGSLSTLVDSTWKNVAENHFKGKSFPNLRSGMG